MVCFQSTPNPRPRPHPRQHLHLWLLVVLCVSGLLILGPAPGQAVPLIGGSGGGASSSNFEYKRYCSNTLSDAIRLICGGRYNSLGRKFPESFGTGMYRQRTLKRLTSDDGIFYRPLQSGPIHECCRRPCGYSELKMYCAPD